MKKLMEHSIEKNLIKSNLQISSKDLLSYDKSNIYTFFIRLFNNLN